MCTSMCVWTTRAVLNPISYLCKNMYAAQRRALFVSLRVRGVVTMMASLYTLGRHVHNRRTNDEMLLHSYIYIYTQDVPVRHFPVELSGALGLGPWKRPSPDIIPKPTVQINRQSDVSPTRKPQNLVRFAFMCLSFPGRC